MRMDRISRTDAGTLLVRALRALGSAAGCPIHVESIADRPWSSATFEGTRHTAIVAAEAGAGFDGWLAALPEAEFALPAHLVADCVVDAVARTGDIARATLTVLTLVAHGG